MQNKNKESFRQILIVSIGVCLVCSIFVSSSVVILKPIQEKNKLLEKMSTIVFAAGLVESLNSKSTDIKLLYDKLKIKIIDLSTGLPIENQEEYFDIKQKIESNDESIFVQIPQSQDIAKIVKKPKYSFVYILEDNNKIKTIILPIYGKGLWSTMYGFLSLDEDLSTVKKIIFYEHGETPGLGGEIDNPNWQQIWVGKKIYDNNYNLQIEVIKGHVDSNSPNAIHKVDGLSGATLTTNGVNNLIHFWMSEEGFKPFLLNLKKGQR